MPSAGCFAFAAAVRMIDRVHGNTTDLRTLAQPAAAASLTDIDVFMFHVADLTQGRFALAVDQANFA